MKPTPQEIENRLQEIDPEIEFLALENAGADGLRLYIDREGGVTLEVCQQVTSGLSELLLHYSLEVSSPGPERPLTKPSHFERFSGRRARVETTEPFGDRRKFTGYIVEAGSETFVFESDGQKFEIPYTSVDRSHLVPEIPQGAAK